MLYAFLGSSLIGALTAAWLIYRKAVAENALTATQAKLATSEANEKAWTQSYALLQDQLTRANATLKLTETQRDEYLKELQDTGSPGVFADLLRARNTGHQDPA